MSQPTTYVRAYNFTNYQATQPSDPLPADKVDLELNLVKTSLDETQANLRLLQRDDGAIKNRSVGFDQFKAEVSTGFNPPTPWLTDANYISRDTVFINAAFYLCEESHISDVFATDLAAGKWSLIADLSSIPTGLPAVPVALDYLRRNASNSAYEGRTPAQVLTDIGGEKEIHAATEKTAPVDADEFGLWDSVGLLLKKVTWAKLKETLLAYFVTVFLRYDVVQVLTALQQGQARANIGADSLAGFRNKLINGDFSIWQRAASQTASGYGSDDRWANANSGSTKTHSRQAFAVGQTDVPGEPEFFSRTIVTSVAGAGNYAAKGQNIEDVRTLAGRKATLTVYAKADSAKSVALELFQSFGTGGSPSALNIFSAGKIALTATWQKFTRVVDIPSIAGKTLGSNDNDYLGLNIWFDAGSTHNARTDSLGQQSGTFDIAHVSIVEGDATAEADPFSPRHIQQEEALCKRYCRAISIASGARVAVCQAYSTVAVFGMIAEFEAMRATPTVAGDVTKFSPSLADSSTASAITSGSLSVHGNKVSLDGAIGSAVLVAGFATVVKANAATTLMLDAEL